MGPLMTEGPSLDFSGLRKKFLIRDILCETEGIVPINESNAKLKP